MSLEKLFESVDEKILTDDFKTELNEMFETAVDAKVGEELEAKEEELNESFKSKEAELEGVYKNKIEQLEERVEDYLNEAVKTYVESNEIALNESVQKEKLDAMLAAFDSMLITAGVDVKQINEATDETLIYSELEEVKSKLNQVMNENIELKKRKQESAKKILINEMAQDLPLTKQESFKELASIVELNEGEDAIDYYNKLELILENVNSKSNGRKVEDEKLNESFDNGEAWKRFV